MIVSKLLYSFHIPLSLLLASVKQNQWKVPRYILQAVWDGIQPQVCQQGGLLCSIALPGNLQQPANNPQSNPQCQLWQCGILMTATWGFRSLLIYILGCRFLLLYIFFLTRILGTSCWLNREDCYCHWEGRKPVCLHCWVRKTSKSSCCPVSWNDKENPYGYKNWSH